MTYAQIRRRGILLPKETVKVSKESFDEEIRNELPGIIVESNSQVPIQIEIRGEGLHGIHSEIPILSVDYEGKRAWAEIGDIFVIVSIPKLSWRDRLKILLGGG